MWMSSTSSQNCALQFPSVPFHFRFLSTPVHLCHYSVSAIVHLLAFNWHLLPLSFNRIRKELLNTLPNLSPPLLTGASCLRLHSTSLEMANSFFFFENIALFTSTCCNEPSCNNACSKDICVNRALLAHTVPFVGTVRASNGGASSVWPPLTTMFVQNTHAITVTVPPW